MAINILTCICNLVFSWIRESNSHGFAFFLGCRCCVPFSCGRGSCSLLVRDPIHGSLFLCSSLSFWLKQNSWLSHSFGLDQTTACRGVSKVLRSLNGNLVIMTLRLSCPCLENRQFATSHGFLRMGSLSRGESVHVFPQKIFYVWNMPQTCLCCIFSRYG